MRRLSFGCPAPTGWKGWEPHTEELSRTRAAVRVQLFPVDLGSEARPLPPDYSVKMGSRGLGSVLYALEQKKPADIAGWPYGARVSLGFALQYTERICAPTLIEPAARVATGGIHSS